MDHFLKPTALERLMNKTVGTFTRFGLGPGYLRLLEVKGRTSGRIYATPVNILQIDGRSYLVGGRGHTAWSRNAKAAGDVTLRRGRASKRYRVISVPDSEKPPILKAYLEEYRRTVQRFFTVRAGSAVEAFSVIADRHPVFELHEL